MKKILAVLLLGIILAGCTSTKTQKVNPMAVQALSGSEEYTVEMILGEGQ